MAEDKNKQNDRSRYRSSFGATILFSGVQVFQILISIIKSKFVAMLIGPAGFGIQSLLQSTTGTISAATNLGINTSSVKTIAAANSVGDKYLIAKNVTAQRRLIWFTGLLGMVICAILAPVWSLASFGDYSYTLSFVLVSTVILFDQLNKGETALLQGMQQKKQLAKAHIIGQSLNALITIPLYFVWGVNAIVAALIIGAIIALIISVSYTRKLRVEKVEMSWRETFKIGHEMIKLGFFLSLQYLMATLVVWIIRNYVSNIGGVDDVGLYTAGTTIVTSYLGLVFTAMATDYFPRLAATRNNEEMKLAVRTQAEITILLLAPLAVFFILLCKPFIILLYSDKFLPIEHMMYWSVGAVLFQAMGWAMSHTLLAKAKPSVFFINELVAVFYGTPIKIFFFKYWGLTGFGIATLVVYALYLIQVLIITKKLFNLSYELPLWRLFLLLNVPIAVILFIELSLSVTMGYLIGSLVFIITGTYAFFRLNSKLELIPYLKKKFNR